ncbi:MAG: Gfo/Idh/MocA family oxidoreductase [Candidatus Omnitrophica bacterium]|nr:Gfo/Idh/MocA family oxidoreductase [Candidatus Omnitrophota bacterium]MDD5736839.1 Gfo/Idh/MocA family oxidoreductase [Candidatus Omnitrophota bacterium]
MAKLNIIVVGTGMYVCGRGTPGYGTIMPAIFEWARSGKAGEIIVAGRSARGAREAGKKINDLRRQMGVRASVKVLPAKKDDPRAYMKAIKGISGPACAIIATPDNLHKEAAETAMKAGLHTLVVKPLVAVLKDAKSLIALQDKKKVFCAVEFHKRYDDANLNLRDAIRKGTIGDPLYFLVEFSQRKSMPSKIFRAWAETTNIFQYLGIHYADMVYFVTGARPVRVSAIGQKNWLKSRGIDTYDAVEAVIEWKMPGMKRFVSHILTNWIDPETTSAMSDQKIKVIGTKGRFESDQKKRGITVVTDEKGIDEPNPYFCSAFGSAGSLNYRGYGIESIRQFLEDAKNVGEGRQTFEELEGKRPTFRQSVVSTAVLEAVNRSLKQAGRWVKVKR